MALYNERVYAYDRMKALNEVIDEHPEKSGQMVANDNSNHLAFLELSNYEKTGTFLYMHPVLKDYKQENELDALRKADPTRFMQEMVNAEKSITRYNSLIKNKKYKSDEELKNWQEKINFYKHKLTVMQQLISKS